MDVYGHWPRDERDFPIHEMEQGILCLDKTMENFRGSQNGSKDWQGAIRPS